MIYYKGDTVLIKSICKVGKIIGVDRGSIHPYKVHYEGPYSVCKGIALELISRAFCVGDTVKVIDRYALNSWLSPPYGRERVIARNDYSKNGDYIYQDTKGYCWKSDHFELISRAGGGCVPTVLNEKETFFGNLPRYLRPRKVHITPSRKNITVFWKDGTTTTVTAQNRFDVNMGFGMALMKKVFGDVEPRIEIRI